ncbi:hypothetical protein OIU80_19945 [Flavobacterium sp. LS1R47]|uniref:Uncharacterized protein n=1 Tax=Flavobacterium frigoritolerans TaxID=2987686 RepID=A0A9X3CAE0_9FLAO|nr:hypothetical protein [Flavobacterium frigoritolerans]MCV9934560.1 hypothetical protein [Flavobacterium frigoritolerans]
MKLKKRIKDLEIEISELKKQVQNSSVTITDSCNPNSKVIISLNDGVFMIGKTTLTLTPQIILKDNK